MPITIRSLRTQYCSAAPPASAPTPTDGYSPKLLHPVWRLRATLPSVALPCHSRLGRLNFVEFWFPTKSLFWRPEPMFVESTQGAGAPTTPPAQKSTTEPIRHVIYGSAQAIHITIKDLHRRGYAEPNDWSRLVATGRGNEMLAILTKRVVVKRSNQ